MGHDGAREGVHQAGARMPVCQQIAYLGMPMDGLLERMWDMMALVRVYTKRVGCIFASKPPSVHVP